MKTDNLTFREALPDDLEAIVALLTDASAVGAYQGGWRATIESVRTETELRGQGIGAALVRHAIEPARARHCVLMQLSSHASRVDARRFYERLGFEASHVGMKLLL